MKLLGSARHIICNKMISVDCKQRTELPVTSVMIDYFTKSRDSISQPELQKVRRVLFGNIDRDSTESFVNKELEKQFAFDSKKWNFDFINEKTLDPKGNYLWKAQIRKKQLKHAKRKSSLVEEAYDTSELYFDAASMCRKRKEDKEKSDTKHNVPGVQRLMTDYMLVRKRTSAESSKNRSTSPISIKKSRLAAS